MKAIYAILCITLIYLFVTLAVGENASAQEQNPIKDPLAQAQIVGGEEADPGEWPWQAVVFPGPFMCGGSLIHREWIITAAHCVHDKSGNLMAPQNINVILGEHDLSIISGTEQNRSISQVIRHPDYDPQTADNDIALLRLSTPADLVAGVSTIPLVTSPSDDILMTAGSIAWVTGWGATEEGNPTTNVLREVDVLFIADKSCNLSYGGDITENMICAGYAAGGKDACQGDSGGPLVVQSSNGWKQAGIVSWGYGCARPDKYGVYTRLSRYTAWISQQTGIGIGPTSTPLPTATPISTPTPIPTVQTPTPSPTPSPTATATPTIVQEILRNGDFERGSNSGWSEESSTLGPQEGTIIYPASALAIAPHSGQYGAWLGGLSPEISDLAQSITLPEDQSVSLRFYYQIRSAEADCVHDVAYVRVNSDPVFPFKLCADGVTDGWMTGTVDLSNFAGQTITIGFRLQNDETDVSSLFIDDVEIEVDSTEPTPTTTTEPSGTPSASPVRNGDFEAGANGDWSEQSANFGGRGEIILSNIDLPEKIPAQSGLYAAWLGGAHNETSTLRQEIVVPSGAPTLYYFTKISSNDVCGYDAATVSIDDVVVVTHLLCRNRSEVEWEEHSIPLNDYAGKSVMLEFRVVTDGSLVSSFFIDNVSVDTVQPTPEATETSPSAETISLVVDPGATGIRTSWSVAIDPRVTSYRVLRRLTQELTEIATTSATFYQDLESSTNALATSARYCYQIEALTDSATVVATSNVACAVHGQLSLWIPNIVGAPSSEIRVPINIVNAHDLRIRGADIWIEYDPNILEIGGIAKSTLTQEYEWSYSSEGNGTDRRRLQISGVPQDTENPQAVYGDGPLFALHFKVIGSAGDKSPLLLRHNINGTGGSNITIVTSSGDTNVPLRLEDGFLEVQSKPLYSRGDADGNGLIESADIAQVLHYAVIDAESSEQALNAADLNRNRKIEAADAAMLAYYVANRQWPVPPMTTDPSPTSLPTAVPTEAPTPTPTSEPTATPSGSTTIPTLEDATAADVTVRRLMEKARLATSLSLTDAKFAPDRVATIAITARNLQEFAGGDLIITYDPTIISEILTIEKGVEVSSFDLAYANDRKGKLTISLAGKEAYSGDMTLVTLTLKIAPGALEGNYALALASVNLSDSQGRDYITSFPSNSLELLSARTVIGANDNRIYLPAVMK